MKKLILDACCGGRMFWFNKRHPNTIYMDIRVHEKRENKYRPNFTVKPDIIADFRKMPFKDNSFKLVVFDPPHAFNGNKGSVIGDYYGKLSKENWKQDITMKKERLLKKIRRYWAMQAFFGLSY